MRIGVTNDDGIAAPGIARLVTALVGLGHEVVVCAPQGEMSGAGASTGGDLRIRGGIEVVETQVAGIRAYGAAAPPATCALLLVRGAFSEPLDLIVSGINPGQNLGVTVLHSGTVGAVLTAGNFGVPGLAISMCAGVEADDEVWDASVAVATLVLEHIPESGHSGIASLNVPGRPLADIKGLRTTTLDSTPGFRATGVETLHQHDDGRVHLAFTYAPLERESDSETDVRAIAEGYASLTWLQTISVAERPHWTPRLEAASVTRGMTT
ncbi:MAG: 5'/3'-nucleotidase SurE [Actinobacteria bacterium]|nr:5'/3'-nucleotidase SurE [Actinomycetota bacterium]